MDFTELRHLAEQIETECGKAIIGKGEQIRLVLTSLFAGGHVLIDDIPGVGKTTLVKALSAVLGCGMVRVQFTPDLLPSDIVGMNIYSQKTGEMVFTPRPHHDQHPAGGRDQPGHPPHPVRPAGGHGGTAGVRRRRHLSPGPTLHGPGHPEPRGDGDHLRPARCPAGPLPLQALHGLPYPQGGGRHAPNRGRWSRLCGPPPLLSPEEINRFTREIRQVRLSDPVVAYIVELVQATREQPELACGASPRVSGTCSRASKAYAALSGRDYVTPDDVKYLARYVLPHRVLLSHQAALSGLEAAGVVETVLAQVPCRETGEVLAHGQNA